MREARARVSQLAPPASLGWGLVERNAVGTGGDRGLGSEHVQRRARARTRELVPPSSWGAGRGRLEVVDLLLNKGARVDGTDSANQTALHKAAASGSTSVCRTLALALADTNAVCNGGVTPLMLAAKSANLECAQVRSWAGSGFGVRG